MKDEWKIYGADDILKAIATKIEYSGSWMEESYVTANGILSPAPVHFQIGDWLEYRGERFEINYEPEVTKVAAANTYGEAFKYENIKFNSPDDELTRCDFLDCTLNDNNIHFTSLPTFSFYAASVTDLADRIQANLDRLYSGARKWTVEVHPEYASNTNRNISIDKIKVKEALALCVSEFGCNFVRRGRTITIGTAGLPADHLFKMGKGNGLKEIAQTADTDQLIVTRLRVYGSERNLPRRYYNSLSDADGKKIVPDNMAVTHLMLPGFGKTTLDPYIDSPNIEALGIREDTVFFDGSDEDHPEIFPSIEEMTADQLKAAGISTTASGRLDEIMGATQVTDNGVGEEKSGEITPESDTFQITLKDVGFDINDYWTDETPVVLFKTGMLGGREFEIVQSGDDKPKQNADGTWTYTLKRVYDDAIQLFFPYSAYNAKSGDQFVLLHIDMPDAYIKAASQRLLEHGKEYLSKHDYARKTYSPAVDDVFMAEQHRLAQTTDIISLHDTIREGDLMVFEDTDLGIENASIFIDSIVIKEGESAIPQYEITLKEEKTVGTLQKIQNQIDSIKGGQGSGGYNAAQIRNLISLYGANLFLSKTRSDSTPYRLGASEGFEAGNFVSGTSGAATDRHGNAEVESIVVRSFMKVFELIYNRLNALEGNTSFADSGTIESIEQISGDTYRATMRQRWKGDFTAFQVGDIVYGYVNDLRGELPDDDNDGNTESGGFRYYKAWACVTEVDRENNVLTLSAYKDSEVPAQKNFPMREGMLISRWGNALNPDSEAVRNNPDYGSFIVEKNGRWINTRQQSFYISCEDGNIVQLMGVNSPILVDNQPGNDGKYSNYGTVLGLLPEGLLDPKTAEHINAGQPYLYARGIVVQDLMLIDYKGQPVQSPNFRGDWDKATAESDEDYYRRTFSTVDFTVHNGAMWQCQTSRASSEEPSETNNDWLRVTGDLDVWQIVPSVDKINIRDNGRTDKTLECLVRVTSFAGVTDIATPEELDKYNKELVFSLDGVRYNEFWVRQGEQIDGTGLDHSGNNIPWIEVTDRILLTLRNKTSHEEATTVSVPVIKDGAVGAKGADGKPGADGNSVENRYYIAHGYPDTLDFYTDEQRGERYPKNFSSTYAGVPYGDSLWQISAHIDGDNNLIGQWSEAVMLTAKPTPAKPGPIAYPAGVYDKDIIYDSTNGTCPVVLDADRYYLLKEGNTYCGKWKDNVTEFDTPSEDYARNADSVWEMMTQFSSVFAKILMADFAKLSQAVFWGDYMFSEWGVDANGVKGNNYRDIINGNFTPNLLIDLSKGRLTGRDVELTGYINAQRGFIGNLEIEGNSLVGKDEHGAVRVRIGVGNVPNVNATFSETSVAFTTFCDDSRQNIYCEDADNTHRASIWFDADYSLNRDDNTDTANLYIRDAAGIRFHLNQSATRLNIGHFNVWAETTLGSIPNLTDATKYATAYLYRVNGSQRTLTGSYNLIGQGNEDIVVEGDFPASDYEIEISAGIMESAFGASEFWCGKFYVDIDGVWATMLTAGMENYEGQTIIASDGFISLQSQTRYAKFTMEGGFEARYGGHGFRVGKDGLQRLKGNGEWENF